MRRGPLRKQGGTLTRSRPLTRGRQRVAHKHEDGLLWGDADTLADDINKLAHREVGRHQVPATEHGAHETIGRRAARP